MYYLVDAGQIDIEGRTHVVLRSRDEELNSRIHIIPFTSYFYAGVGEGIFDERITYDVLNRPVIRIEERLSRNVGKKKDYYPYTCEANINVYYRLMIDREIYTVYDIIDGKVQGLGRVDSNIRPKIMYFDIELSVHPDYELDSGEWRIVSIQACFNWNWDTHVFIVDINDSMNDEHVFVLDDRIEHTITKERIGLSGLDDLVVVAKIHKAYSEKELLTDFMKFYRKEKPDYLEGWYSNYFDIPTLIKGLERNGIDKRWLSPVFNKKYINNPAFNNIVSLSKEFNSSGKYMKIETPNILGIQPVDMLDMYKKLNVTSQKTIKTWDLKDCVRDELMYSYFDIGGEFRYYHLNKINEALDYCVKDALVLKLFDMAVDLSNHYETYRELFGILINDGMKFTQAYKILLLRIADKPIPTKSPSIKKEEQKGAKVLIPARSGVVKWTCYLDFKALYPYLMRMTNAGLETFVKRSDRIAEFRKDKKSLMVQAMDVPAEYRERLRELEHKYDPNDPYQNFLKKRIIRREKSAKSAANSAYGVSGYYNFVMYSWEANQKITFEGREIITWMQEQLNNNGFEVIYGDTDGLMVDLELLVDEYDNELDNYIESGKILEKFVNWKAREYAKNIGWDEPPIIKLETISKAVIFQFKRGESRMAKKKYVKYIVWKEGFKVKELEKMGVQSKRSDTAELTKNLFDKFFEYILIEDNVDKALDLVKNEYNRVIQGKATQKEICVPHGLRTTNQNYWVAKAVNYAQKYMGQKYNPNIKPRILYIKEIKGKPTTKHLAIVNDNYYGEDVVIDYKTTAEKIIVDKIEPFLRSLNVSFEQLLKGQERIDYYSSTRTNT